MDTCKERLLTCLQTLPVNYLEACRDALNEGNYDTVENVIDLVLGKFRRNPDLRINTDLQALGVAMELLTRLKK